MPINMDSLPSERDALAWLMSEDENLTKEEPQLASAISQQLKHMELSSLDIVSIRRIRDVALRHNPKKIIEVGGGIGYLSSWILDIFSSQENKPEYTIVESGNKFAAILLRLIQRFNAVEWAKIISMKFQELVGECNAWLLSNKALINSSNLEAINSPAPVPSDLIIIDVGSEEQVECIRDGLTILAKNGLLLTIEPPVPFEGASNEHIDQFQNWIDLIREIKDSHRVAFVPLEKTTLVGIMSN